MEDFAFEFFDAQIAGNVGPQRAERVSERRGTEAGMKFLSDGPATDHFTAFEDQRLEAALRKIKSGDERIVPAADENYALSDGHV